jgi:uncharacterized membrane protein YadS
LFTVGFFRTLDMCHDAGVTLALWRRAFTPVAIVCLFDGALWASLGLSLPEWVLIGMGVVAMWLVGRAIPRLGTPTELSPADRLSRRPVLFAIVCALMVVCIAVFGHYGLGYDVKDFIYGQF